MTKVRLADLDRNGKRAVVWLADESETPTPMITAAATHVGEIWEAFAFVRAFPKGTQQHMALVARLRLGSMSCEGILDCIKRVAPEYCTLAERTEDDLEDLLADLNRIDRGIC
jgi:hypothetical protein